MNMENEQEKKNFLIKVGVGTIMSLILIFWVLNAKNVFLSGSEDVKSPDEVTALKNDFIETIDSMGDGLNEVKKTGAELTLASSSLINELIIETGKIVSSSTDLATSSTENNIKPQATSSSSFPSIPLVDPAVKKNTINCPAYINCMPTIEPTRSQPCQIPAGCEGITQIAY